MNHVAGLCLKMGLVLGERVRVMSCWEERAAEAENRMRKELPNILDDCSGGNQKYILEGFSW